ncbi:hypothetical protein L218DRAFT_948830 [Marasmius fiardii PR-910]|nr:hypothetical protein L218DRAFT_948830 [Marasmius fiardii PR-910]
MVRNSHGPLGTSLSNSNWHTVLGDEATAKSWKRVSIGRDTKMALAIGLPEDGPKVNEDIDDSPGSMFQCGKSETGIYFVIMAMFDGQVQLGNTTSFIPNPSAQGQVATLNSECPQTSKRAPPAFYMVVQLSSVILTLALNILNHSGNHYLGNGYSSTSAIQDKRI